VAPDSMRQWTFNDRSEIDLEACGPALSAEPQCPRGSAVHRIGQGPWIDAMVCCTRRRGHQGEDSISLGDASASGRSQETWLLKWFEE
jgi:hypothetical protein